MKKLTLILVIFVLFAFGCSQTVKVNFTDSTIDDLKLLPDKSTAYFFCDFSKVSDSDLAQEFLPLFNEELQKEFHDNNYEDFKEMTGFDPEKDFKSILIAMNRERGYNEKSHIVIHGKFKEDKITKYLVEKAAEAGEEIPWHVEKIEDYSVYLIEKSNDNFGFCFFDDNTLYVGEFDWISSVLKDEYLGISTEKVKQLNNSIQYGKHLWFSVQPQKDDLQEPFQDMMKNVFPLFDSISSLTISAHVDDGIKFLGNINCDSPETSELMVDMMKGALAAAKLHVYKDRDAVDAINRIKMKVKDNKVLIRGSLDKEFFDKLQEYSMLPWKSRKKTS